MLLTAQSADSEWWLRPVRRAAGIDYREIPSWAITRTLSSEEHIRDDDPVRVAVTMTVDDNDDELTLVLDETLDVITYHGA